MEKFIGSYTLRQTGPKTWEVRKGEKTVARGTQKECEVAARRLRDYDASNKG